MKLALGTVQFGLDYGISNNNGKVDKHAAFDIINLAKKNNIKTLDTATAYGDSERLIGDIGQHFRNDFNIITKITSSQHSNDIDNPVELNDLQTQLNSSLKRLQINSIYAVMLHDANELSSDNAKKTFQQLLQLKENGLCQKIGVSVYTTKQLNNILDNFKIDIVQIPLNIFDQQFNQTELIKKIKENKIEVHARSLFLQGLLLMNISEIPPFFEPYKKYFQQLSSFCQDNKLTKLEACLSFAKSISFVDKFVVGVNSLNELSQIVNAYHKVRPLDFSTFSSSCTTLTNPSQWPTKE